jgi:putative multidrug export ATP-binding/permease protein ygaD
MIGGGVALFYMNWKLSILVVMIIPIKFFLNSQFKKSTYQCSLELKKNNENYNFWFEDVTKGDIDIRLYNLKDIILGEYKKLNRNNIFTFRKKKLLYKSYNCIVDCVEKISVYLIYVIASYDMLNGGMSVGEIISFVGFSSYLLSPVDVLLHFIMLIKDVEPSMESYERFMNYELEDVVRDEVIEIDEIRKIKFKNVSFRIEGTNVLDDLNFEINRGDKVAFIGDNGSGKTSCVNLITRLYEKSSGKIFINDIEIEKIDIRKYRKSISAVCQHVYLFNKTIIENITLDSKSDFNDKIIFLENCNLFKFVHRLPDGWETQVGSSGNKLSGGEKQKIALGRVLNRNTSVIILDEPTSAYDKESVEDFNKWLFKEFSDKIVIIVTHDKRVLDFVNKIFEFKNGKITIYNKLK